jgi:hypothetical protein
MKYRFILFAMVCAGVTSCTFEKKLYSSGYHIEWLHTKNEKQEFTSPNENKEVSTPVLSASESSDVMLVPEEFKTIPTSELTLSSDTVIPENPSKADEEYVTPGVHSNDFLNSSDQENLVLTEKDKAKLDRLTKWLITSAILSIFPLYFLYVPILVINLLIIDKIQRLAKLSHNETYYSRKIKQYWRIIIWPLYVMAFFILLLIVLLALYGI